MDTLYEMIQRAGGNGEYKTAVVVKGENLGERILLSEGKAVWKSEGTFLANHLKEIEKAAGNCITEIDGRRVFCECIGRQKELVICGGGHVSLPIIQIGRGIGFHVTVLEDRPKFAGIAKKAGAHTVICRPFEQGMKEVEGSLDTYFVIVTRGHRYDSACLREAVRKPNAYVGMMGSRNRVKIVKQSLAEEGISKEALEEVYAPVGLPIGAETPEEIGVSVMAEIIQVKNTKKRSNAYDWELLKHLTDESYKDRRRILATIISRKGSAPRKTGTKMLVSEDGAITGTIGGGCAESEVIQKALQMIRTGKKTEVCTVDMTGQEAEEAGMVCGGVIEVLLEAVAHA